MLGLATLAFALATVTTIDDFSFDNTEQADRYSALIEEIRCPKCLNTNLAGSDAPIAHDLRRTIYGLLEEGKTDQEIRDFVRARYGDFALYDPRLTPKTLVLWFAPVVFVLAAILLILQVGNRRKKVQLSDEDRMRLQNFTE